MNADNVPEICFKCGLYKSFSTACSTCNKIMDFDKPEFRTLRRIPNNPGSLNG